MSKFSHVRNLLVATLTAFLLVSGAGLGAAAASAEEIEADQATAAQMSEQAPVEKIPAEALEEQEPAPTPGPASPPSAEGGTDSNAKETSAAAGEGAAPQIEQLAEVVDIRSLSQVKVLEADDAGITLEATVRGLDSELLTDGVYVGIIETGTAENASTESIIGTKWVRSIPESGDVTQKIVASAETLDENKKYEVLVWKGHSNPGIDNNLVTLPVNISAAQWSAVFPKPSEPAGPVLAVTPSVGLSDGDTVTVSGEGYNPDQAIYVTTCTNVDLGEVDFGFINDGCTTGAKVVYGHGARDRGGNPRSLQFDADGAFEFEFAVTKREGSTAVYTIANHTAMDDRSQDAKAVVEFAPAQPVEPDPNPGVTPKPPEPSNTATGQLEWGVKSDFRDYIRGPIAHGSITVKKPATQNGNKNKYSFPQVAGGTWNGKSGSVKYAGNVNFNGHNGALDVNLNNPVIVVKNTSEAVLRITQNGRSIALATIDLKSATRKNLSGSAVRFTDANVTLAETGVSHFDSFYDAGSALDKITFTIGKASNAKPVDAPKPAKKPAQQPAAKPAAPAVQATGSKAAGSLSWGVSSAFASYVTGPISKGSVGTSGVGSSGGTYLFPQAAGGSWNAATQTGTVQYSGVVTFTGHKGLLRESMSNPVIQVTSSSSATIFSGGAKWGTLNLAAASKSVGSNGEVTWSGVPVSGGFSGGASGGGQYSLGADPLTFTVGAASGVTYGSTAVSADDKKNVAADAVPTTSGIRVITPKDDIVSGGEIEFEAQGFEAKERDVLVVLYAPGGGPEVLDEAAGANDGGTVRWIGTLPDDITGDYAITVQGSTDAGATIDIGDPDEKDKKKELTDKEAAAQDVKSGLVGEPTAAGVITATTSMPLWSWWVGSLALLLLAGGMTGMVLVQRRRIA